MRASSSVVSQFLTAVNLLVVLVLTPFMASAQSYDVSFIHTDHLGSPVVVTSVTGDVTWSAQFSAYGKEYQGTGTPTQDPIGFAGSSNDRQTGLVYMQARFYDPDIGRFLSVDPVGFTTDNLMSFNRYLYVNNNPYAYVDPDGEFLKAITTAVKVGYKAIKARKNPIKAIGEELVGAVDDAMTIFDGQWTIADLAATADLLIGTDLNNKATRTARAVPRGLLNPREIRFTQDSIGSSFRDGRPVQGLIDDLKAGRVSADDVPAIRVFQRDGQTFTLDNRRLYAFQQADVPILTRPATSREIADEAFKFTTRNSGASVRVRGNRL